MDQFMEAALEEARTGAAEGGIPIGAALVDGEDRLVATGRNRRVQDRAVVMHAEINCLFNAGKTVSDFRGMTMYSTLMPCHMCAGADAAEIALNGRVMNSVRHGGPDSKTEDSALIGMRVGL